VMCGLRIVHPGRFPESSFPVILGLLGPQCAVRASKCSSGTFPRIEFPGHSWAYVVYGLRSFHPGCFPESSFPGILRLLWSPMCCVGFEVFVRDVSPNRISRAFLGFWCPQCAVRASKYSSGTFSRSEFPGHSWAFGVPNVL
jgi:hypothetical protein